MATFTPEELALALEIHQAVRALNSRLSDARALGLHVMLRLDEVEQGGQPEANGLEPELKVVVFKASFGAADEAAATGEPDAVLPHGWTG